MSESDERYVAVKGAYWWRIKVGDGEATYGRFYTQGQAEEICQLLTKAFRDGEFVANERLNSPTGADAISMALSALNPTLITADKARAEFEKWWEKGLVGGGNAEKYIALAAWKRALQWRAALYSLDVLVQSEQH